MEILDILKSKLNEINCADFYLDVEFKQNEITAVMNLTNLRALKLRYKFPKDFKSSKSIEECFNLVKETSDLYRVLEYFFICNNIVKSPIVQVFPRIIQ